MILYEKSVIKNINKIANSINVQFILGTLKGNFDRISGESI